MFAEYMHSAEYSDYADNRDGYSQLVVRSQSTDMRLGKGERGMAWPGKLRCLVWGGWVSVLCGCATERCNVHDSCGQVVFSDTPVPEPIGGYANIEPQRRDVKEESNTSPRGATLVIENPEASSILPSRGRETRYTASRSWMFRSSSVRDTRSAISDSPTRYVESPLKTQPTDSGSGAPFPDRVFNQYGSIPNPASANNRQDTFGNSEAQPEVILPQPGLGADRVGQAEETGVGSPDSNQMLQSLLARAEASYGGIDNYVSILIRQERVGGKLAPRERIRLSFRKNPWSIHLVWLSKPKAGRQLVFVPGHYDNKIHGREPTFFGAIPLKMDPHGSLARRNSRHPITEAGIGSLIKRFRRDLARAKRGTIRYIGVEAYGSSSRPMHHVRSVSANQWRRDLYFDTQSALPTLLEVVDSNGERLEFYSFENLEMNIPKLNNPDAFNPARVLP